MGNSSRDVFVGRKDELDAFLKVLESVEGQAVVVAGPAGMGKTTLVNRMVYLAEKHPDLTCGCVRQEVIQGDSVDAILEVILDRMFQAASITEGSLAGTDRRLKQWKAFLDVFKVGDLVMSLGGNEKKLAREKFIDQINLISRNINEDQRAVFIIDPEKYMHPQSDEAWACVVRQLPDKIKFVFAQRNDDVLVDSDAFGLLGNVFHIPKGKLDVLDEEAANELVELRAGETQYNAETLKRELARYDRYPYAIDAALGLLADGMGLEDLPDSNEPVKFAQRQWERICTKSEDAIKLFCAYAVLEVAVPDDVVIAVSGIDDTTFMKLKADKYVNGMLREEGANRRIYHSIPADYILNKMTDGQRQEYHKRAVEFYRAKLKDAKEKQTRPDEIAAVRLSEHVLEAYGKEEFVLTFVNECWASLQTLGFFDEMISLSSKAHGIVQADSEADATLSGNLGSLFFTLGYLDRAFEMYTKSFNIYSHLEYQEGVAMQYGNIGNVYYRKGDYCTALEMVNKALKINRQLGRLEGMASQYSNMSVILATQGNLAMAVQKLNEALEINKQLKRLDGMADVYGNLGNIYKTQGRLDKALEKYVKALEINKQLGRLEGMAIIYGNIGVVYSTQGNLDKAMEMYSKSLEIDEKLGRLEGMATQYCNMGNIRAMRGEREKALEYWEKAKKLYLRIGAVHKVKEMQGWIDGVNGGE